MQVQVKLFATLRKFLPPGQKAVALTMNDGATVRDALEQLGIPDRSVHQAMVNGAQQSRDHPLRDGDTVSVFPPVAGG
jgi:molybdopterin converting factor small subunit